MSLGLGREGAKRVIKGTLEMLYTLIVHGLFRGWLLLNHDQYEPKVDRLCKENFANVALLLDTATKLLFINRLLP